MSPTPQTDPWPNIAELLDQPGGHISIGRMPPIEGAAIAINDQTLLASLVRREGETFPDLLKRLDAAIGKAVHEGAVTNEINGGRFQLAPSSIRKKTLADSASSGRTCTQYRPASVRSPCVRDYTVTMNRTAQRDRLRQLGLFWERVAMPQWGALSEPTRVEVLRLIAQLLREARAGNSALRSEGPAMSDRIKTQHLARKAILYGRRSTAYQVENNLESQKLQYAMEAHLRALGWNCIEIVDEDLGRSASGTVTRTGFERMISTRWPLLVTPTANGLAYFTYLYERLPFATTAADLEALLPWNVKPLLAASIENCIPMSAQVRDQVSIFASA